MLCRVTDVQGLINRWGEGTVNKLLAWENMSLGNKTNANCLMEHGVYQHNIIGFEGYNGAEARLFKQLLCENTNTVPMSLKYKWSITQVRQTNAFLAR